MFAHVKQFAGQRLKLWAIVEPRGPGDWILKQIIVQDGGENNWEADEMEGGCLESDCTGDTFHLFGPEDKRVPGAIVAEFMRRALLGEGT